MLLLPFSDVCLLLAETLLCEHTGPETLLFGGALEAGAPSVFRFHLHMGFVCLKIPKQKGEERTL